VTRVFNFPAGPAVLPEPVLRRAAEEMLDWNGSGMSVVEMSHRGKEFMSIHAQALSDLREPMAIPAQYEVLFMQGGALAGNAIVPMNLMGPRGVEGFEARNAEKARLLYDAIDASGLYENRVERRWRSRMNVPFFLKDERPDEAFLAGAKEAGLLQLKGQPLGRRHARVDLQRDAARGRARARRLPAGFRTPPRLSARRRRRG
jgi:phosphoserine aminotransferase